MCALLFSNYTEEEKIDLLKDYMDMLLYGECVNYDLYYKLQNNNKLKRAFFREVIPLAFDEIDLEKLFMDNLLKMGELYLCQKKIVKVKTFIDFYL